MPTCKECGNKIFESTSFDSEGNHIEYGKIGHKCTNCYSVTITTKRTPKKFYNVQSYWWSGTEGLEKANKFESFRRLTEKKVKEISEAGHELYLTLCDGDTIKYYVVYWFESGSYELQEKTEDEIYS